MYFIYFLIRNPLTELQTQNTNKLQVTNTNGLVWFGLVLGSIQWSVVYLIILPYTTKHQ